MSAVHEIAIFAWGLSSGAVLTGFGMALSHTFSRRPPAEPAALFDPADIINRKLDKIMNDLTDAEATEAADLKALADKVDQAVTAIGNFAATTSAAVAAAVTKALADAGVDDAAALAATQAADAVIKAETQKLADAMSPPVAAAPVADAPAPVEPTPEAPPAPDAPVADAPAPDAPTAEAPLTPDQPA